MGYAKWEAEKVVSNCIDEIQDIKNKIVKNFDDMDFQNAVTKNEFEAIIDDMLRNCDQLIANINSYSFN